MNRKGLISTIIAIVVVLALGYVVFQFYWPTLLAIGELKPELSVSGVSFNSFDVEGQCYSSVGGYVHNEGEGTESVVIKCSLFGTISPKGEKSIGNLDKDSKEYFEMVIEHDCFFPSDVECHADCSNC